MQSMYLLLFFIYATHKTSSEYIIVRYNLQNRLPLIKLFEQILRNILHYASELLGSSIEFPLNTKFFLCPVVFHIIRIFIAGRKIVTALRGVRLGRFLNVIKNLYYGIIREIKFYLHFLGSMILIVIAMCEMLYGVLLGRPRVCCRLGDYLYWLLVSVCSVHFFRFLVK